MLADSGSGNHRRRRENDGEYIREPYVRDGDRVVLVDFHGRFWRGRLPRSVNIAAIHGEGKVFLRYGRGHRPVRPLVRRSPRREWRCKNNIQMPSGKDPDSGQSSARDRLRDRVVRAAEAALSDHSYVSAVDVLCGTGLLSASHLRQWRNGQVPFLEQAIQANLHKISRMQMFRQWALEKGLKPSETRYVRRTRSGIADLQFSKSGDPKIEANYRTHFVSPVLSERKQKRLQEKLDDAPEAVVFRIIRDSQCSECGVEIDRNSFLSMEANQPLCLSCARLDDLEFLPSGDAALTRRSGKYSRRVAVVVRFSRSRGRYERQGILVEPSAIERAERECVEDADERAAAREQGAKRGGKRIKCWRHRWQSRSGSCIRDVHLLKRQPSPDTPASGAAGVSAAPKRPASSMRMP